jgi:hypothetical protein
MWYAVSLLYKSVHIPTEAKPTLWEESIRLIQARTESEARDEAEKSILAVLERLGSRKSVDAVRLRGCRKPVHPRRQRVEIVPAACGARPGREAEGLVAKHLKRKRDLTR